MSENKIQKTHLYHPGHYKAVAHTLFGRKPDENDCSFEYWVSMCLTFAHDFKQDNETFRPGRFLHDCGVPDRFIPKGYSR